MIDYQENNKVDVIGYVDGEIVSSHRVHGEEFLTFTLRVPRLSEAHDLINTTISKRLLAPEITNGAKVWISGQYRSYNNYDDRGNKLILTLFVQEIALADEAEKPHSEIVLDGFICKEPVYRKTPFGREIADILLAVNRAYNKSDYIPCIAWGRNARFCERLTVGQNIRITGRIQSREYQKKLSETETVTKTAYEVSISRIETADEEQENIEQ